MLCLQCKVSIDEGLQACPTCRRPALLAGKYELVNLLGSGGMGAVYRARDRFLGDPVAIKVLEGTTGDPEKVQRFREEIRLARRVTHKNICRIHDYGESEGLQYISMELVEGTELKRLIREKRLDRDRAFEIAIQIARGVQAIHDEGVIHRDLKPANVMIDGEGTAKVMDFGIAKAEGQRGPTRTGMMIGTPAYMSPEQIRGDRSISFVSDVYSLGVVVYELFTGEVPFQGDPRAVIPWLHLTAPPPLDRPPASELPSPLLAVLRKALEKEPAARFASAEEMALALERAREPPPPRNWPPWVTALLVLVLIGGAFFLVTVVRPGAQRAASSPPVVPASHALGTPAVPLEAAPTARPRETPSPSQSKGRARPPDPSAGPPRVAPSPAATSISVLPSPSPTAPAPGSPSPVSTAFPTPAPTPPAVPVAIPAELSGSLLVTVLPFGDVTVDGESAGRFTGSKRLTLPAGSHVLRFAHPGYKPATRTVEIVAGATQTLFITVEDDLVPLGPARSPHP